MLSQPGKVTARRAEKEKGEEEVAVYSGAERGRARVQGCCLSPALGGFSALELGSVDRITQAPYPLSSSWLWSMAGNFRR